MRKYLKLHLIIFIAGQTILPATAQISKRNLSQSDLHRRYILSVLNQQFLTRTAEKPTGTKQRVIAQKQSNSSLWDSVSYFYSGSKGSRFNYNNFTYNETLNIGWSPAEIMPNWIVPSDVLADTIIGLENEQVAYRDYGTYRPDNQLSFIQSELGAWAFPNDRYRQVIAYDAANRPITYYTFSYSSTTPADTTNIRRFYYKSNVKLDVDSSWIKDNGMWAFETTTKYHYDSGSARIVDSMFSISSSILYPGRITTYTYYPDGKLETMKSVVYNAGAPAQILNDSLGYTFNVPYATYWEHKYISAVTGNTVSRQMEIFHPNATTNLPDSARWIIISSSSQSEKIYRYEYNSFQNPEKITVYNSTSPTSNPYNEYRFYYGTYDDGVAISELKKHDNLLVYPNPFNDKVSIANDGDQELAAVSLVSISGQVVFTRNVKWKPGTHSFSCSDIAPGIYKLVLQTVRGTVFRTALVKK
jgi:hypothetical protein